jgi:hypothetical protein
MAAQLRLRQAVREAERAKSFDPLVKYFSRGPWVRLGPQDRALLRRLLTQLQYKRKKRGRFAPVERLSAKQRNEIGTEHVRQLMREAKERGEKLSREAAIDCVVRESPSWFGHTGEGLASHIKRHGLGNSHIKSHI